MDINEDSFWEKLPDLLAIIACADYIALDLEMSGIVVKDSLGAGALTLDQAYRRAAAAASTFQAIQLGMTAIQWKDGHYRSYTFKIPITPMLSSATREQRQMADALDRRITFSHNSLLFLRENNVDVLEVLNKGVSYLSRQELGELHDHLFNEEPGEKTRDLVDFKSLDAFDLKFAKTAREDLQAWRDANPLAGDKFEVFEPKGDYVRITTERIVSHIVREDFPECRCWRKWNSRAMCVVLRSPGDLERRAAALEAKRTAVRKQIGVSWIIRALVHGGKLYDLEHAEILLQLGPPSTTILNSLGLDVDKWKKDMRAQFERHWLMRRTKRPILIGHSVTYDLCFLYAMLIGRLPDHFALFEREISKLFPFVVDTRIMVRDIIDPDVRHVDLKDIFQDLGCQMYPYVDTILDWGYTSARNVSELTKYAHSADFDSYMTAIVFLKLACKRWRRAKWIMPTRQDDMLQGPLDSIMDRYLSGEDIHLPDFSHDIFASVRNRLRMSTAGYLRLDIDELWRQELVRLSSKLEEDGSRRNARVSCGSGSITATRGDDVPTDIALAAKKTLEDMRDGQTREGKAKDTKLEEYYNRWLCDMRK